MNRIMTIQPFGHQSLRRASHRQLGIGNLVLDDGVNDGVQLLPREADPGMPMICQHEINPFLLIQRKPLVRMRLHKWIISPGRDFLVLKR